MQFEWNDNKAALNLAKHGVSFDEAASAFDDPLYIDFFDPEHSDDLVGVLRGVGCQVGVFAGCQNTVMAKDFVYFKQVNA